MKYAIITNASQPSNYIEYFKFNQKEEILKRIIIREDQNNWYWKLLTPGEEFEVKIESCISNEQGIKLLANSPENNSTITFNYTNKSNGLGKWEFPALNNGVYNIVVAEEGYLKNFKKVFPNDNH